ncbi:MAG: ABC transporter transmembrane domain-containing protein, partial [Bacteroidota bacterium]
MRRLTHLLWPHARGHKLTLLAGAILSALLIALRIAQPWPLKWIIDSISQSPITFSWFNLEPQQAIIGFSLLYILFAILAALAEYRQRIMLAGLGNRVLFSFRNQLFSHLLLQPLAFHERRDVGELLTRVVYDTARLRRGVNGILIRTFQVLFMFLAIIGVLLWL